jgi:hypothetical protein
METIESIQENIQQTQQSANIAEGKKESIESARYSAETTLKDSNLREGIGRGFGGFLGFLILMGSITNVIEDFKIKKKNIWTYSRIILDFIASGALIGYALENTLLGLKVGGIIGLTTLVAECVFIRSK